MIENLTTNDGRVANWWLARPEARNAVTLEMWDELGRLASQVATNSHVRVVVIRGRGEHFSAGADIVGLGRALAADADGSTYRATNAATEAAISNLATPTIAAIDGYCIGGGVQLALSCDIRIATHRAQFAVTPAKLGITYPANALRRLVAIVGPAIATELVLTGTSIDAYRAREVGLVHHLVDDLDGAIDAQVATLLKRSALTQAATKAVIAAVIEAVDVNELGREWERRSLSHGDVDEGLSAFVNKREPRFGDRPI